MTTRWARTPAAERLDWILAGLDGTAGWGTDAADVLAPEFAAFVEPARYVEVVQRRALTYAPLTIVGMDVADHTARARLRRPDGTVDVVTCVVTPTAPHRIASTWTIGLVPTDVTPRLPLDFADTPWDDARPAAGRTRLVVFSGVPGVGKSTLADAVGARLGVPVFSGDWLLGALTPFGGRHLDHMMDIGAELLTTLATRQLMLGQSAILDFPVEDVATRARWHSLAERAGARFDAIRCVCRDPAVHRARVEGRVRGIPGWHDAGDWANVTQRTAAFPPWESPVLTVDTAQPRDTIVDAVLHYLEADDRGASPATATT